MPLVASHVDARTLGVMESSSPTRLWTPSIRRLVSHRRQPSTVAAEYGSPPEIAGRTDAGVGLDVLTRAAGRPLTAGACVGNRLVSD
jgi:hypothetical protein